MSHRRAGSSSLVLRSAGSMESGWMELPASVSHLLVKPAFRLTEFRTPAQEPSFESSLHYPVSPGSTARCTGRGRNRPAYKWKVLILRDLLLHGTMQFGDVSQKILTSQPRQMEQSGLVNRKVYAEVPPFRVFSTDFFCFIFLSAQSCSSFRSFRHTFPAIPCTASLEV